MAETEFVKKLQATIDALEKTAITVRDLIKSVKEIKDDIQKKKDDK